MKFKTEKDRTEYAEITGPYQGTENILLRQFVEILETISKITGHGELTITSYLRTSNKKSLHAYGRALDIRVRDKSDDWYLAMIKLGEVFERLNPQFRIQVHIENKNTPNEHLHVEIRDKK